MKKQRDRIIIGGDSEWTKQLHEIPGEKNGFGFTWEVSEEKSLVSNAGMH